jgi:hypothetical protein
MPNTIQIETQRYELSRTGLRATLAKRPDVVAWSLAGCIFVLGLVLAPTFEQCTGAVAPIWYALLQWGAPAGLLLAAALSVRVRENAAAKVVAAIGGVFAAGVAGMILTFASAGGCATF